MVVLLHMLNMEALVTVAILILNKAVFVLCKIVVKPLLQHRIISRVGILTVNMAPVLWKYVSQCLTYSMLQNGRLS